MQVIAWQIVLLLLRGRPSLVEQTSSVDVPVLVYFTITRVLLLSSPDFVTPIETSNSLPGTPCVKISSMEGAEKLFPPFSTPVIHLPRPLPEHPRPSTLSLCKPDGSAS